MPSFPGNKLEKMESRYACEFEVAAKVQKISSFEAVSLVKVVNQRQKSWRIQHSFKKHSLGNGSLVGQFTIDTDTPLTYRYGVDS